jgi:carbonyl reductase 1
LGRGGGRWWSAGTVAVVTGGNKGLGFEIVRRLAVEGLTVILTARSERRGLQSTRELHSQGLQNVVFRTLDISSPESVEEFAEWLRYAYGGLDILVNNAAIFHDDNKYDNAVECLNVNYYGTIDVIEKLLPLLRASPAGARIVTLSSWAGRLLVSTH